MIIKDFNPTKKAHNSKFLCKLGVASIIKPNYCLIIKLSFLELKPTILLIIGIVWIQALSGQDTLRFKGVLSNGLLYESFELYPDSTFKWKNEYDLSWQEFGSYEIKGNKLNLHHYIKLNRPKTMRVADSIALVSKAFRITNYEFVDSNLYKLNNQSKRIKKVKDKSIGKKWSWLFGYWYDIGFIKIN